jgi:hypothetical protein
VVQEAVQEGRRGDGPGGEKSPKIARLSPGSALKAAIASGCILGGCPLQAPFEREIIAGLVGNENRCGSRHRRGRGGSPARAVGYRSRRRGRRRCGRQAPPVAAGLPGTPWRVAGGRGSDGGPRPRPQNCQAESIWNRSANARRRAWRAASTQNSS